MNSTVSVVLAGYNQAAYLDGAIASVLDQTHRELELIVVDNGSTDGSQALLKKYEGDPRVRLLLHATNAAVTTRLNEAIAVASGQFVSILYADDYYLPHKLERQLDAFSRLPPDYGVVYSPGYRLDAATGRRWIDRTLRRSGSVLKDMFLEHYTEGFINPISPLMRRECFIDHPFDEDVFMEGESIFLRFAMTYKFSFLDEPLTVMREHDSNVGKAVKRNAATAFVLLDKLVKDPRFPPDTLGALGVFRTNFTAVCGWLAIRMAVDPEWARVCFLSAVRSQPSLLLRPRILAGLVLSILPASAICRFNTALNAVRSHKETVAFRADYT